MPGESLLPPDFSAPFFFPRPCTDHLRESFPGYKVEFVNKSRSEALQPPFRIAFPPSQQAAAASAAPAAKGKRKAAEAASEQQPRQQEQAAAAEAPTLVVESYTPTDPGPYPQDQPPQNAVRFTPVQTQAVLSGVQPGLTMVVGPPGEGGEGRGGGGCLGPG